MNKLFCSPAIAFIVAAAAHAQTGNVLVANQQSGSATIVDVATRETTTIEVGTGPHETVVSPDGKWGIVTIYVSAARRGWGTSSR